MFRGIVHFLANLCGAFAAAFLAGIAIATMVQIVARQLGIAVETTEISGFFLAASTFLGLSYTLIHGGHVRVSLVSQFVGQSFRRIVELWVCLIGIGITGYTAWNVGMFARESFVFGELSPGFMAIPMWIPQFAVAFGLFVLLLAMVEQGLMVLRGQEPDYATNTDTVEE